LFVNTVTTSTASLMNFRRDSLDIAFTFPFLCSSVIFAPLGTYAAQRIDVHYVKIFFVIFLFFSSYLMIARKRYRESTAKFYIWGLLPLGGVVGFMSGLLGIGGGALIIPALSLMGLSPKKIAVTTSFMIPFSTLSAFVSYLFVIEIDWFLVGITTVAALLGGYTGNRIMHFSLSERQLKYGLAGILCLVACKMLWDLWKIRGV